MHICPSAITMPYWHMADTTMYSYINTTEQHVHGDDDSQENL